MMQNELLESILEIDKQEITDEISNYKYLAVMCDDTTDVFDKSQMVVVFMYEKDGKPVERFWGFFELTSLTAQSLAIILLEELLGLVGHDPDKLIAQTYDGATALNGIRNGVQALIKPKLFNLFSLMHLCKNTLYFMHPQVQKSFAKPSISVVYP